MLRASLFIGVAAILSPGVAYAQLIGVMGPPGPAIGSSPPFTAIDDSYGATANTVIDSATFRWSNTPCSAAAKLKFFTRRGSDPVLHFMEERGPFDVNSSPQTVDLLPPVVIYRGELIGIAALTSCGQPTTFLPPRVGDHVLVISDDVTSDFAPVADNFRPTAMALMGEDENFLYLMGRFTVTLEATDPRTGRRTTGRAVPLGSKSGYFSLPDFTGDPEFPEVIVKLADATTSPPPFGGSFWFFYSSLTDVQYTLSVIDQATRKARIYSNAFGGPGQLCGGVDTDAFRP